PAGCSKGRSEPLPREAPRDSPHTCGLLRRPQRGVSRGRAARLGEAPFGAGGWPQPPRKTKDRAQTPPQGAKVFGQPPYLRAAPKTAARRIARETAPGAGRSPPERQRTERATALAERRPFDSPHTCGLLERPQRGVSRESRRRGLAAAPQKDKGPSADSAARSEGLRTAPIPAGCSEDRSEANRARAGAGGWPQPPRKRKDRAQTPQRGVSRERRRPAWGGAFGAGGW